MQVRACRGWSSPYREILRTDHKMPNQSNVLVMLFLAWNWKSTCGREGNVNSEYDIDHIISGRGVQQLQDCYADGSGIFSTL